MRGPRLPAIALLAAVTACESPLALPASIDLQVDSVIELGSTAHASVVVRDAGGGTISKAYVEWEIASGPLWGWNGPGVGTEILSIDAATRMVSARGIGRAWLIAKAGDLRDSTLIHGEETLAGAIGFTLGVFEVAPGAQFGVSATISHYEFLAPNRQGRWFTSDTAVAGWSPITTTPYQVQLTMRAPGRATVGVEYGGKRGAVDIVVREPGPLVMDEAGVCGLNAAGELWCKGSNAAGRLATLTATTYYRGTRQQDSPVPVRGAPGMTFTMISGDGGQSCGISKADARAYCWGLNAAPHATTGFRLGGLSGNAHCPEGDLSIAYARYSCSFVPLAVDRLLAEPLHFRAIKSIYNRTCGVTVSGDETWCWGDTDVPTRRETLPAGWPAWP